MADRMESAEEFTRELIAIMVGYFGDDISGILRNYYDDPGEMYGVAMDMLAKSIGVKQAKRALHGLGERYSDIFDP